jgi:hypothetical protein
MPKSLRVYIAILLLPLLVQPSTTFAATQEYVHPQSKGDGIISYNFAFPLGTTAGYIDDVSWRGLSLQGTFKVSPSIGVGFLLGWRYFSESTSNAQEVKDNVTVTGQEYKSIDVAPVLFIIREDFQNSSKWIPFASLGIGTFYTYQSTQLGIYNRLHSGWQFALAPELGIRTETQDSFGFVTSIRYEYGFRTDSVPNLSYLAITAGVLMPF